MMEIAEVNKMLDDAVKVRGMRTITVAAGDDIHKIRHQDFARTIHFDSSTSFAVVRQSTNLVDVRMSYAKDAVRQILDGYTTHKTADNAINAARRLLKLNKTAYVIDKLGNVYGLRFKSLRYLTNILGEG